MSLRSLGLPLVMSLALSVVAYQMSPARPGLGALAGYEIRDIRHHTLPDNPAAVTAVSFTVTPNPGAAARARARLSSTGPWFPCLFDGTVATCPTPGVRLDSVDRTAVTIDG